MKRVLTSIQWQLLSPSRYSRLPRHQAAAARHSPSTAMLWVIVHGLDRRELLRVSYYLTQACQSMVAVDARVLVVGGVLVLDHGQSE